MSKTPPVVSGTASTPTRYVSTFWTAIGWHGVLTHFGVIMTGNRWTRYRRISKDAEPEPMIIAAHVRRGDAASAAREWVEHNVARVGERQHEELDQRARERRRM